MKRFTANLLVAVSLMLAPTACFAEWFDNDHALIERGKQLFQTGQWDEALRPLNDAISHDGQNAEAYYWRALVLHSLHQTDNALSDLKQAIDLDAQQPEYYVSRGLMYSNQKEYEKALADFDQALKIDPYLEAARTNRQFVVQETERAKKAKLEAERAAKEQAEKLAQAQANQEQQNLVAVAPDTVAKGALAVSNSQGGDKSGVLKAGQAAKSDAERLARERKKAEQLAEKQKLAFVHLEKEKQAQEQVLREQVERERAEKQHIARELAEAKRLAGRAGKGKGNLSGAETDEQVNKVVQDKWALIVGISKFNDPSLNLHYPSKDAKDFYDYLIKDGNFAKDHVKLLVDEQATRTHILSELGDKWLPRVAGPDDLVVIYISSHGSSSELDPVGGVNYLLAYDSDVDNLYATGIPMQDLARIIKGRVHSDRVVVVLDACHSGAASPDAKGLVRANVNAKEMMLGTGQLVISSSKPDQVSWEAMNEQNSVFTKYLIEALHHSGTQTTLGEAFQVMRDRVQQHVQRERGVLQTPVLLSKWEGRDLLLAVPAANPRPGL